MRPGPQASKICFVLMLSKLKILISLKTINVQNHYTVSINVRSTLLNSTMPPNTTTTIKIQL